MDSLVGKRRRSRFIEEAVREKLIRDAQTEALRSGVGVLSPEDHPEWSTPEAISEWVAEQRRATTKAETNEVVTSE